LDCGASTAVRLLPVGTADVRGGSPHEESQADRCRYRCRDVGQHLPVRHVSTHSPRDSSCGYGLREGVMATAQTLDRRMFLKVSAAAGGGLIVSGFLPELQDAIAPRLKAAGVFEPNIWVKIAADDTVTIKLTQLEMGQGVMTSMPMLLAEDLDFDWS